MVSPTRGARPNIDAMRQVGGELKSVDLSAVELKVLDFMRLSDTLPLAATEQAALAYANGTGNLSGG